MAAARRAAARAALRLTAGAPRRTMAGMSDPVPTYPDPWRHARRIGAQLAAWALLSLALAAVSWWVAGGAGADVAATLRAVALQFAVWGAIDGAIAAFGERDRRRRLSRAEDRDAGASVAFAARLRRLLRLNAVLDVGYVAVGVALLLAWRTPEGLGHGLGVLIQGGFLLAFDAWHGWGVGVGRAPRSGPHRSAT
jgi:hypothetical protein